MPELSRFFGIIIRMFTEAGGQHYVAHFHAYWQDEVAVIRIEPVELIAGSCPRASDGWWKPGQSCISGNCLTTGIGCSKVSRRCQSNL